MWEVLVIAAIVAILWLVYKANQPIPFNPQPARQKVKTDLSFDELRKYDGVKDKNTFIALKGIIYDVTGSPFYEPGSGYHMFTGHDASINLAKMSH